MIGGELRITYMSGEWLLMLHYVVFGAGCLAWHSWPCHDEPAKLCAVCGGVEATHLRGVSWGGVPTLICPALPPEGWVLTS